MMRDFALALMFATIIGAIISFSDKASQRAVRFAFWCGAVEGAGTLLAEPDRSTFKRMCADVRKTAGIDRWEAGRK